MPMCGGTHIRLRFSQSSAAWTSCCIGCREPAVSTDRRAMPSQVEREHAEAGTRASGLGHRRPSQRAMRDVANAPAAPPAPSADLGVPAAARVTPSAARMDTVVGGTRASRAAAHNTTTAQTAIAAMRRHATHPSSTARYSRTARVEADEDRAADQRVADRHLVDVRHPPEDRQVVQVEVVAGVHAEAAVVRASGGVRRTARGCAVSSVATASERPRERLRVKLHAVARRCRRPSPPRPARDRRTGSRARRATAGPSTTAAHLADGVSWPASRPGW